MKSLDSFGSFSNENSWVNEPVDSLNLSNRSIKWLHRSGVKKVRDLILLNEADVKAIPNLGKECFIEISRALRQAGLKLGAAGDGHENIKPLASHALDDSFSLSVPITLLNLSRRSQNALEREKILTLKELIQLSWEDIEAIPSLGLGSVNEISKALDSRGLELGTKISGNPSHDKKSDLGSVPDISVVPSGFNVINIQQLGFSIRTINCLKSAGISDAFTLASQTFSSLTCIPNMGKKSLAEINVSLAALYKACDSSGNFSPSKFTKDSDYINCIPSDYLENNPEEFIGAIQDFFQEFCAILDDRERAIMEGRIIPSEGRLLTLEELGQKFEVTREGIRQIEKKVVNKLAGLLCEGESIRSRKNKSTYICDIEFSNKWQKAVLEFEGVDETALYTFIRRLCDIWDIELAALLPVLPLVIVVFTRSTTTILSREALNDSPISAPMSQASEQVKRMKLSSFRIGKNTKVLAINGMLTIDDLINNWPIEIENLTATKNIVGKLIKAEEYLNSDGSLNWDEYRSHLGIKEINFTEPTSSKQLFCEIGDALSECIPHLTSWANCREVFDMRTRLAPEERATLQKCSEVILGNPNRGSNISKIQEYTLDQLARVFVSKDFSFCNIWMPQWILDHVSECHQSFKQSNGDYERFYKLLSNQFSLPKNDISRSSALLWSIFDGLTPDRYFHLKKSVNPSSQKPIELGQKIRLKGFRVVH